MIERMTPPAHRTSPCVALDLVDPLVDDGFLVAKLGLGREGGTRELVLGLVLGLDDLHWAVWT